MRIYLDYETRSECDLKKAGLDEYASHPTTSLLCLAYCIDDGPVELWTNGPYPEIFKYAGDKKVTFVAHNAAFERLITKFHMPEIRIPLGQWECTAARAAYAGLPRSLDGACQALNLAQQKNKDGYFLIRQLCCPRKPTKSNPSKWDNDGKKLQRFYQYCMDDVLAERALSKALPILPPFERQVWMLDQIINDTGIPIDMQLVRRIIALFDELSVDAVKELRRLTKGEIQTGSQVDRLLKWFVKQGCNIDNVTAATIATLTQHENKLVQRVAELRQQLSRASVKKYTGFDSRVGATNRLCGSILYYGGHTGRFASLGVQIHNLPRGILNKNEYDIAIETIETGGYSLLKDWYSDPAGVLASLTRSVITASPGNTLLIVDYDQIELRVAAWLAGEQSLLDQFATGRDVYSTFATKLFNRPVAKDDEATKFERQVGKIANLGLIYGMGAEKFRATCESYGVQISEDLACYTVKLFRETYPEIRNTWYGIDKATIAAVRYEPSNMVAKSSWQMSSRWLAGTTPVGRSLLYFDPKLRMESLVHLGVEKTVPRLSYMGVKSQTREWIRHDTYGAKLFENIDQGVSRDFLCHAMLKLRQAGFRPIFSTHDEIVCETPVNGADAKLEEMMRIMCTLPSWGAGCPLTASGFISRRYRK